MKALTATALLLALSAARSRNPIRSNDHASPL